MTRNFHLSGKNGLDGCSGNRSSRFLHVIAEARAADTTIIFKLQVTSVFFPATCSLGYLKTTYIWEVYAACHSMSFDN